MHAAKFLVTLFRPHSHRIQRFLLALVCTLLLGLTASSAVISQGPSPTSPGSTEDFAQQEDGGSVYLPLVSLGLATSHAGRFETYLGSATCRECHAAQVSEVHGTVH